MFNTSCLLKTFITNGCQSCYCVPSPPPGRRTDRRGLTHGTPQASATGQTRPIWIKSTSSYLQFQKDAFLDLFRKSWVYHLSVAPEVRTKLPAEESKLGLVYPMKVQPRLTTRVSASFLVLTSFSHLRTLDPSCPRFQIHP